MNRLTPERLKARAACRAAGVSRWDERTSTLKSTTSTPGVAAMERVVERARAISWEESPDGNWIVGQYAGNRLMKSIDALERNGKMT